MFSALGSPSGHGAASHVRARSVRPYAGEAAVRYRDELGQGMYRPEWTWIAEDGDRVVARAPSAPGPPCHDPHAGCGDAPGFQRPTDGVHALMLGLP
ncbi:hypothetical protein FNH04_21855 [Streptomyces phyllanthi]|uniref:Uncharacterized protein n=1 Tax=Streptomyces phyllanthi TaxID=1803180 RepID=A0A5N8W4P0_9ACTN|nr:hypothetical protein [Streptomyces phyllanthi]